MSKEAKSGRIARAARHAIEPLESRILLTVAGSPDWVEQGPGPLVGGQVLLPPNNPVAGAITSIAGDSFDLYVGTVGGGIWHTGDASVASPNWAPLTPQYPSLAITALAVDPADSAVVWAGTNALW